MSSVPRENAPTKPLDAPDRVLEFHLLGCLPWERAWSLQRRLMYEATDQFPPRVTVLCCEHPDLITVGRTGSRAHIRLTDEQLRREQLTVRWVGRGGGCVLHAPGQLCIYPIVALDRIGWSVGDYLERLQRGLCAALEELSIHASVREEGFGVWGRSGLLAAIGVAVQNWVTCHGAFLNVHPPMSRFAQIDTVAPESAPHGKTGLSCLLAERRLPVKMTSVRAALVPSLVECFACTRYHLYTGHPLLSQHSEIACEPIARAS